MCGGWGAQMSVLGYHPSLQPQQHQHKIPLGSLLRRTLYRTMGSHHGWKTNIRYRCSKPKLYQICMESAYEGWPLIQKWHVICAAMVGKVRRSQTNLGTWTRNQKCSSFQQPNWPGIRKLVVNVQVVTSERRQKWLSVCFAKHMVLVTPALHSIKLRWWLSSKNR